MTKIGFLHSSDAGWLSVPQVSARVSAEASAGVLARLIASRAAVTKVALTSETGLARSTVSAGLAALERIGLIKPGGLIDHSGRGRPGQEIIINPEFGTIAVIEVDTTGSVIGLYDFGQRLLARIESDVTIADDGADAVGRLATEIFDAIDQCKGADLRIAIMTFPGPVDVSRGVLAAPPYMPGWTGLPLEKLLAERLGCVAMLRNETDVRALGEARHLPQSESPLLYVRVHEGVGSGFTTAEGQLFTGVGGAAGELGHMRTQIREGAVCVCGEKDHVNCHGAASTMKRKWTLHVQEHPDTSPADFEEALRLHVPTAVKIAGDAARVLGIALVDALLLLNPARVTIGGAVAEAGDAVLAAVRSTVYELGFPLATRDLTIAGSVLGADAGLLGGVVLALEEYLSAPQIRELLARTGR